jgi:hypothetical protein
VELEVGYIKSMFKLFLGVKITSIMATKKKNTPTKNLRPEKLGKAPTTPPKRSVECKIFAYTNVCMKGGPPKRKKRRRKKKTLKTLKTNPPSPKTLVTLFHSVDHRLQCLGFFF